MKQEDIQEVLPGKGLGAIQFGWTKDQLEEYLGAADETEEYETPVDEDNVAGSESWHYDNLELSVSFEEQDDWRLGAIAVSAADYVFNGQKLIGKNKEEVLKQIEAMNLGEMVSEDWSSDETPDYIVYSFEDLSLNFWFEAGMLLEIQWGPFWNEDNTPVWPV